MKIRNFRNNQKNAKQAAALARSVKVPFGILKQANDIWQTEHSEEFYGFSYKAMDPLSYAEQQLGLITTTAIANHILRAYRKVKSRPPKPNEQTKIGPLLLDDANYLSTDSRLQGTKGKTAAADTAAIKTNPPVIDVDVQ